MLPNFLIVGAAKAGTSNLYHQLRRHPDIFMPDSKEIRFFNSDHAHLPRAAHTLAQYRALFAAGAARKRRGEATPHYLRSGVAAARISALIPDCRIIVSLRDPVDRAFSSYQMGVRDGYLSGIGFREALAKHAFLRQSYAADLERFTARFDRSRICILCFEDLVATPDRVFRRLYDFLEVAPDATVAPPETRNPGGLPRVPALHRFLSNDRVMRFGRVYLPERLVTAAKKLRGRNLVRQTLSAEDRHAAGGFFREDILRTQQMIDQDISAWLP
jgi:hypothetical protein